jgi:predicted nicotinamide N-methyase
VSAGRIAGDRAAFVRANTRPLPVPHAPEISLHVADEATALWGKTEEELGEMGLPPPFWAFAWAGGQGLARHVLDNPEIVRGRRVLDFASGSGLVAIAAAMAGAVSVDAADIDPFAVAAIGVNAALNGVGGRVAATGENLIGADLGWNAVLAGDICYQKDIAERVMVWLAMLSRRGADVLIGDPGRAYLPKDRLLPVATYRVPTTRALEDSEIKTTTVWRLAT